MAIGWSCHNSSKKDLSLTVEEYQKLGMPDPNKIWTNDDYINSNITLGSLRLTYPLSFPRKYSKKSGALFSRFVNKENLSFVNDTTLPMRYRAFQIQHFQSLQNELNNLYAYTSNEKQYYHAELTDIFIFRLFLQEKMVELADMIMISNDSSSIGMRSGMQAVIIGYVQLIFAILREQEKTGEYLRSDLRRLSTAVSQSLNENLKRIETADRQKIAVEVAKVSEKSKSDFVKKNYRKILKMLQVKEN